MQASPTHTAHSSGLAAKECVKGMWFKGECGSKMELDFTLRGDSTAMAYYSVRTYVSQHTPLWKANN